MVNIEANRILFEVIIIIINIEPYLINLGSQMVKL